MTVDHVAEFIALTERKRELKAHLSRIEKDLREAEGAIVSSWTADGTQRINRNGKTVYLRRDLSVRIGDKAAAREALEALELADLLAPNAAQLKAWLKERMTREDIGEWSVDPDKIPESLRSCLTMEEYTRLGVRADT